MRGLLNFDFTERNVFPFCQEENTIDEISSSSVLPSPDSRVFFFCLDHVGILGR